MTSNALMNTITVDEKREIMRDVIDSCVSNDTDCTVAICCRCSNIMIFDAGNIESGICDTCECLVCKECGGLRWVGETITGEEEVEGEDGEIVVMTTTQFSHTRVLCPDCA